MTIVTCPIRMFVFDVSVMLLPHLFMFPLQRVHDGSPHVVVGIIHFVALKPSLGLVEGTTDESDDRGTGTCSWSVNLRNCGYQARVQHMCYRMTPTGDIPDHMRDTSDDGGQPHVGVKR